MNNTSYIKYDIANDVEVLTITRLNGFSTGKYLSNNFSYDVKDSKKKVEKNYDLLYKRFNVDSNKLTILNQDNCPVYPIIYAKDKEAIVAVLHSDTVPLMFCDAKKGLFGALQVTNFGSKSHIVKETIGILLKKEKINPHDLMVYLAPSLTFSHNIISKKEAKKLIKQGFLRSIKRTSGEYFFDERFNALCDLRKLKIPMANIIQSPYCTYENNDLLFSKKILKKTGKNITIIRFVK
ncbi:MAG: laccase domain-containing protein [Bacilli bacterium]|jgi:copper oxidase (laccase) domain-containing protein